MKTFAMRNGDLVLGSGGFKTITGTTKLRQDLAMAVTQEYGTDRFHPRWGSTLPRMIGRHISRDTEMIVKSEISRVVQQYIDTQRVEILNDKMGFKRTRFTTAEIIGTVENVSAFARFDSIIVQIDLRTVSDQVVSLTRTVDINA